MRLSVFLPNLQDIWLTTLCRSNRPHSDVVDEAPSDHDHICAEPNCNIESGHCGCITSSDRRQNHRQPERKNVSWREDSTLDEFDGTSMIILGVNFNAYDRDETFNDESLHSSVENSPRSGLSALPNSKYYAPNSTALMDPPAAMDPPASIDPPDSIGSLPSKNPPKGSNCKSFWKAFTECLPSCMGCLCSCCCCCIRGRKASKRTTDKTSLDEKNQAGAASE